VTKKIIIVLRILPFAGERKCSLQRRGLKKSRVVYKHQSGVSLRSTMKIHYCLKNSSHSRARGNVLCCAEVKNYTACASASFRFCSACTPAQLRFSFGSATAQLRC
jgi:hypothetical protein